MELSSSNIKKNLFNFLTFRKTETPVVPKNLIKLLNLLYPKELNKLLSPAKT